MKNSLRPNVGVIGAGAMGLYFTARLRDAGVKVRVFDTHPAVQAALKNDFVVESDEGERTYSVDVVLDHDELGQFDIVFVFVKSNQTAAVARVLNAVLSPHTVVVTLQNGLGNRETLEQSQLLTVVAGTTAVGATRLNEGRVRLAGVGETVIGGRTTAAVQKVFTLLTQLGLPVSITAEVDAAIWRKAIINAAINPIAALVGVPNGALLTLPGIQKLQQRVINEAVHVAQTQGLCFSAEALFEVVKTVCKNTQTNLCSMLQDLQAGRPTEIDSINGRMVALAAVAGFALPVNKALTDLIQSRTQDEL